MVAAKEKMLRRETLLTQTKICAEPSRQPATTKTQNQPTTKTNSPTVVNRISSYDFTARKFQKPPIGSTEKIRCIVPLAARTKPRKNTGENLPHVRRLHRAPELSLYRGYFAPKSTDLFGLFQDPQIGDLESQVIVANAWAIVQIQYAHLFVQLRTNSCVVQAPIPQPGMLWGTGFQNQAADGSYVIGVGTMTIPGHDVLPVSDMTISALVHELIHVVDDCNGEGGTCDWIVCLEIRGASGGPQCSSLGEEFSPEWIQCVKDSAIASVTTYFNNNPQCWAGNQDELGYVDGLVNNQFTRCVLSPECVTGGLPDFPEV